jgi:hypothetical protein
MDEAGSPDCRQLLTATLDMIRERLANLALRPHHLVPDLVVYCYATDVLEHCRATLLLVDSEVPRTAYACARAALEATLDLMLLVSEPSDYDKTGARIYVWELLETERLQQRFVLGRHGMGVEVPADLGMSIEEAVTKTAANWGPANAQAETLLRGVLTEFREHAPSHWSGLSRKKITERILDGSPYEGAAAAIDALYGAFSAQTHPRIREWSRKFQFTGWRVAVRENPEDRDRPVEAAWAAAHGAWLALELAVNQLYIA